MFGSHGRDIKNERAGGTLDPRPTAGGGRLSLAAMKTALSMALAVCLGAAVCAEQSAESASAPPLPVQIVPLQKPDADDAARVLSQVGSQSSAAPEGAAASNGEIRIVNGHRAANISDFPYQVALTTSNDSFCGGSLISSRWVLTAAHCIYSGATWVKVFMGAVCWAAAPVRLFATRALLHGAFDDFWLYNDIALLDLGGDLDLGQLAGVVQTVDLETEGCRNSVLDGEQAVVSGWGHTSDSPSVPNEDCLRYVDAETVSNYECCLHYGYTDAGMLCAVNPSGLNGTICRGDSGGPLVWTKTGRQIGINSYYSKACGCEASWPNGYTRVPCYIEWIRKAQSL